LNLQFANTLIHVDSPYNPAIFDQRNGRVHRIGGEHDVVNIVYLVTIGTIDERIQDILETKRKLGEQVVERNDNERALMNDLMKDLHG
jgi:SNF2 family DNA or RNA helicase